MKRRIFTVVPALVLALILTAGFLAGCGAEKKTDGPAAANRGYYDFGDYYPAEAAAYDYDYDYDMYEDYEPAEAAWDGYSSNAKSTQLSAEVPDVKEQNPAKLIYTAEIDMETLEFEAALDALDRLTSENGAYYESSYVSDSGAARRANLTVRVPAENYRAFLDGVAGDQCHILSRREYTEDVSEHYYDVAGRVETQKTKLERLQALLAEAKKMDDIISLESAISETEELIDWFSGTLRHYDAQVDYSTVTITLKEVKVYEPEPDPTYGTRLGMAFSDGLSRFIKGVGNVFVALVSAWLWIVLIVIAAAVVLIATRKRRAARRKAKKEKKAYMAGSGDGSEPVRNEEERE